MGMLPFSTTTRRPLGRNHLCRQGPVRR
jgi:hypothetical protein